MTSSDVVVPAWIADARHGPPSIKRVDRLVAELPPYLRKQLVALFGVALAAGADDVGPLVTPTL